MQDGTPVARGIHLSNCLYQMSFTLVPAPTAMELSLTALMSVPSWETWHQRFGHVRYSGLQKLLDKHLVNGLHINLNMDKPDCITCTEAKMSQAPYGPMKDKLSEPGELTHIDLWGKYDVESIHGNSYYLLLIDDASRYMTGIPKNQKSGHTENTGVYDSPQSARSVTLCHLDGQRN
jgi:hypothetical protein